MEINKETPFITILYAWVQALNTQRHLYSIRTAFISIMPLMLIGAYAVVINNLPIPAYQQFMENLFGASWRIFGALAFNATMQITTIIVAFSIGNNLASWYNFNRQTHIHTGISGMIALVSYLVMTIPIIDAASLTFSLTNVTGLFGGMAIAIIATEAYILLCSSNKITQNISDDPDVVVSQAFASIVPALIVVFGFTAIRMMLSALGITEGLTDIINYFLRLPFETNSQSIGTAILYNISTHLMWLFGIHGNNVLDGVAQGVFAQAAISGNSSIITKTFFDAFIYMGGSGTTLALLIALLLCGRSKRYRTLFKFALPNSIFNVNEPLIFGIPIVLNPVFAIPFVLTPCVVFFTTYLAIALGIVPPVIHDVSWATPVFISGYVSTGSVLGVLLQLFNLVIATAIYIPFVRLSERLSEMRSKVAYQDLVHLVTTDYSSTSRQLLNRVDGMGAVARRLALELAVELDNRKLFLHYQPIINVKNNKIHSVEALLRWNHPLHGRVNPMLIIALAEEAKLINKLGLWVIREAVYQRSIWTKSGLADFKVAVNLSNYQLNAGNFHQQVLAILNEFNVPTSQLELEITETVALVENNATRENIIKLNEAGIDIAMDDFGVGHSSLIYLRTMPIHTLKIDSSLSKDILKHQVTLDIIAAIYDLCRLMNIETIVEHVDNQEQLAKLMQIGDFLIQGYLYSPPLPSSKVSEFVEDFAS